MVVRAQETVQKFVIWYFRKMKRGCVAHSACICQATWRQILQRKRVLHRNNLAQEEIERVRLLKNVLCSLKY